MRRSARTLALAAALALAACRKTPPPAPPPEAEQLASGDVVLRSAHGAFVVRGDAAGAEASLREVRRGEAILTEHVALAATVDGARASVAVDRPRLDAAARAAEATATIVGAAGAPLAATLRFELSPGADAVRVVLAGDALAGRRVSLRARLPGGVAAFVPRAGDVAGDGDAPGAALLAASPGGALSVAARAGNVVARRAEAGGALARGAVVEVESLAADGRDGAALVLATGASEAELAGAAFAAGGAPVRTVRGRVVGAGAQVRVLASDAEGRPLVRVDPGADGRFEAVLPAGPVVLHALAGTMRASDAVRVAPGTDEAEIQVAPGGAATVRVRDRDTGLPLTARVIVQGVPPTADPSFGPDFRASGAGPLLDALRGEATLALPSGRYRVRATRGPEWTIAEATVDVPPGAAPRVELALRHVVDTRGRVGCDLHVHARPSFDSPVTPEDRVLSLVAAGVDFATPTEHNVVGDYTEALATTGLAGELASVRAVEITTTEPQRGHINVYPYDDDEPPPYRKTTLAHIFERARNGHPERIIQINHPRLDDIGYFDLAGFDPRTLRWKKGELRLDFDALEIFNGVDGAAPERVERVLGDWLALLARGKRFVATGNSDSHRIEFGWAGYPRTYVELPPEQAGDGGGPIDVGALLASLKAGHAIVSSGLQLDASIGAARPGDTATVEGGVARLRVRVRAAPWVDASEVEVFAGEASVVRRAIPVAQLEPGALDGPLEAASRATVRFDEEIAVPLPEGARFVVIVARGARSLEETLPFVKMRPMAIANPIWLRAR